MDTKQLRLGYYDSQISPEQIKTGLLLANFSTSAFIIRMLLLATPGIPSINWLRVAQGGLLVIAVGAVISFRYVLQYKKHLNSFGATEAIFLLIAVVIAIGFFNVGLDNKDGMDNYSYFLVVSLVGIIGNYPMRMLIWIASVTSYIASNWVISTQHSGSFWAGSIYFATTLLIVTLMIGAIMSTLAGRNRLRITINSMVAHCCKFSSMEQAYAEAVKLIPFAVPSIAVVAFVGNSPDSNRNILGFWTQENILPQDILQDDELQELLVSSSITTNAKYLIMPAGFTEIGEIFLVVRRKKTMGYSSRYPDEVAYFIGGGLLRINSEVANLSRLTKESLTDSLTGLANRRALELRLDSETSHSHRSNSPLVIVMLDLDNFKTINDTYGHQMGDEILRRLAVLMTARIRRQDMSARYGGEEFLLILPDTDIDGAVNLIEELMREFKAVTDSINLSKSLSVTFSSGIALFEPGESVDSFVYRSDQALYMAKRTGKNRYVIAEQQSIVQN